jgi:hypothetical protein
MPLQAMLVMDEVLHINLCPENRTYLDSLESYLEVVVVSSNIISVPNISYLVSIRKDGKYYTATSRSAYNVLLRGILFKHILCKLILSPIHITCV